MFPPPAGYLIHTCSVHTFPCTQLGEPWLGGRKRGFGWEMYQVFSLITIGIGASYPSAVGAHPVHSRVFSLTLDPYSLDARSASPGGTTRHVSRYCQISSWRHDLLRIMELHPQRGNNLGGVFLPCDLQQVSQDFLLWPPHG